MRDAETGSQWLHYTGECVLGPLAGRALAMLDTNLMTWPTFRERYPGASVIENTPSLFRRLLGRFNSAREAPSVFRLPSWFTRTMREKPRSPLRAAEFGIGVVLGQRSLLGGVKARGAKFYPYARLKPLGCVQESVADVPVLVRWDARADSALAFRARVGDATPRFSLDGDVLVDDLGNRYAPDGTATDGPARGERLQLLTSIATRWYGFEQSYPEAEVFTAPT